LLDHDASQIELTARFGYKVFYGDARRLELLRAAGAARAKLLVVAFGNRERTVDLVKTVRSHFPDLKILARAYDRAHAYELMAAGAHRVIRETFGSALLTGQEALKLLGNSEERAHRIMKLFQEHDESGLKKAYEFWGDDVAYGRHIRQELKELEKVLQDDQQDREGHSPPR
jgi:voltage-gated potassium channel Kch